MAFDFGKLSRAGTISSITDPASLFDALPNKAPGYGYLRAVQKTVLDMWSPRRRERDLVIKTNTGGGKTIAGLLILQTCLNEGVSPALYLAPEPDLARRVIDEATKLGLPTVGDPDAADFLGGRAICVTTMQKFLNGKTRFGLLGNPYRQPVRIGAIVIDDAHAALATTEEQTRTVVPREHDLWDALVNLFEDELKAQSAAAFMDIQQRVRSAVVRVPFWAWRDKADQVLAIMHRRRSDPILEWGWPLIGDILPLCAAVVTSDGSRSCRPARPLRNYEASLMLNDVSTSQLLWPTTVCLSLTSMPIPRASPVHSCPTQLLTSVIG